MHKFALFLIAASCVQAQPKLKVWFPPSLARDQIRAQAMEINAFLDSRGQAWDAHGDSSTALRWTGTEWNFQQSNGQPLSLGSSITHQILEARIRSGAILRPILPPSTGLVQRMALSEAPFAPKIEEVSSREQADYELLGRYGDYELQYSWARVTPLPNELNDLVPAFTDWITVPDNARVYDAIEYLKADLNDVWRRALLFDHARRAGRPFRLRLQNAASGEFAKSSYHEGEAYRAVAERDSATPGSAATMYLALFATDQDGHIDQVGDQVEVKAHARTIKFAGTFNITPPDGVDHYVLLAASSRFPENILAIWDDDSARITVSTNGLSNTWNALLGADLASFDCQASKPSPPGTSELRRETRLALASYRNLQIARSLKIDVYRVEMSDILKRIPSKTSLLIYGFEEDRFCIWLVGNGSLLGFHSADISRKAIDELIAAYRVGLGIPRDQKLRGVAIPERGPTATDSSATTRLSVLLFPKEILAPMEQFPHLIIVPVAGLSTVPFAILDPQGAGPLIERHTITIAPSLTSLAGEIPATWNGNFATPLIVGDPAFPFDADEAFPDLPGARQEAAHIAETLHAQALLGGAATKAAVLARVQDADLLHFATHAVASIEDPLDGSFILFAGPDLKSGSWTAREIQDTRLHARLAVLSACQTGLGRAQDAGIIGLARAFQIAGVPRVLMSLWSVNDAASAELMNRFHDLLKRLPPADALQQAMLATRNVFPDPRFWGSFALFGSD